MNDASARPDRAEPGLRPRRSAKCCHLEFRRLTVDGLAEVLDRTLEGLPGLPDNVLIGSDDALSRHAQAVRLERHVCSEFALALRRTVEAYRSTDILIPVVAG